MVGDPHTRRAAELFDVPEEDVTETQRQIAKRFNFMAAYSAPPKATIKDAWWHQHRRKDDDR